MNCIEAARHLTGYLDGSLEPTIRASYEEHCGGCAECRELIRLWGALDELPGPGAVPTEAMRRRLMLAAAATTDGGLTLPRAGAARRPWGAGPALLLAAAAAASLLLVALGWLAGRQTAPPSPETAALRDEVRHLRSMVAVSLLNQESASARLQGISYAGRMTPPEGRDAREVIKALTATLRYDPNVNVRLAACDALRRYASDGTVRRAFIESLGVEQSPLVKLSLIDALVNFRERGSLGNLERLRADGAEDDSVKARAAKAIEQIQAH